MCPGSPGTGEKAGPHHRTHLTAVPEQSALPGPELGGERISLILVSPAQPSAWRALNVNNRSGRC